MADTEAADASAFTEPQARHVVYCGGLFLPILPHLEGLMLMLC
jgi:hypothetical protein